MALPLTINGQVFEYPQNFDEDWGVDATGWAQAVTAGALYLSGGSFPLTAQVDFGSSFGIKVKSLLSKTTNPATAGYLALAKTDAIEWRNNANSANLALGIDGSDNLTFNGTVLGTSSLTNAHIFVGNVSNVPADVALSGDATLVNTGALTIANSAITNAKVSASAAIALSKLASTTISRALQSDGSGLISPSSVTSTELGYLSGVTGAVQTQIDAHLPLSGGTMSGAVNMASHKITGVTNGSNTGEAITWDQLPAQTGTITNWVAYTPVFTGLGTVTNIQFWWKRVGDEMQVRGIATAGTVTSATTSLTLPNSLKTDPAKISSQNAGADFSVVGVFGVAQNSANFCVMLADGNDNLIFFGEGSAGTKAINSLTGTSGFTSGMTFTVSFGVPITGWSI